jgi:hypothetical protein
MLRSFRALSISRSWRTAPQRNLSNQPVHVTDRERGIHTLQGTPFVLLPNVTSRDPTIATFAATSD